MYHMLFGVNPYCLLLIRMLGLEKEDFARFRDAWTIDEGKKILVLTRNGAGNSKCPLETGDPEVKSCEDCWWGGWDPCPPRAIENLRKHKYYITDYEDDFDETYMYFEFRTPEEYLPTTKLIFELQGGEPKPLREKFEEVIREIEKKPLEELKKDPRFKGIIEALENILKKIHSCD